MVCILRTLLKIYVALEDYQKYHQSTMVEIEGNIVEKPLSILTYPRSSHSYVTPKIFDSCSLKKCTNSNPCLV